jgi:gas vesicle protein
MNGKGTVILSLVGLGVGSALMYLFDPSAGKRRRAQARNQTKRCLRSAQKMIDTTSHTLEKVKRMDLADIGKALVPVTAKALLWR